MVFNGGVNVQGAGFSGATSGCKNVKGKETSNSSQAGDIFSPGYSEAAAGIVPDPTKSASSTFAKQVRMNNANISRQAAQNEQPPAGGQASSNTIGKHENLSPEYLENQSYKNLREMDLRDKADLLKASSFTSKTPWPSADKMPPKEQFDPDKMLEENMDPGRGIKDLHKQGIDGRGVNVATVDTPLNPNHEQIKDCLVAYHTDHCGESKRPVMHGQAVSSLIAGKNIGTAPGAKLHHYSAPEALYGPEPIVDNFKDILKYNEGKDLKDRIRVASASMGYESSELDKVVKQLEDSGTMVVMAGDNGIGGAQVPLGKDKNDINNYESPFYVKERPKEMLGGTEPKRTKYLAAPIDNRTVASNDGENSYRFDGRAGTSWAAPDLGGIAAMGFQVFPDMTPDQARQFMTETGKSTGKTGIIVDPKAFIARVQAEKAKSNQAGEQ